MKISDKDKSDIGKEPDLMNSEDLLEYIQLFIYLFNKNIFWTLQFTRDVLKDDEQYFLGITL